jgi:hypothetical protein
MAACRQPINTIEPKECRPICAEAGFDNNRLVGYSVDQDRSFAAGASGSIAFRRYRPGPAS